MESLYVIIKKLKFSNMLKLVIIWVDVNIRLY